MATNKRIMKELGDINTNPPPGCKITTKDEDINNWEVVMDGPDDSVYKGGRFHIQITLPKEYPFKPPTLAFRTKIYHPNVNNDDRGTMCLGILRSDEWKPPNKIVDVLKLVRAVLSAPQPEDAVEPGIADHFRNDRKGFDKQAQEWVKKYAK